MLVTGKTEEALTSAISACWINVFGPMQRLTLDEETGMRGRVAQDWAVYCGVTLHFKAPRQKAWLVERHNEILRQALHRTETQVKQESLISSFQWVLAIVTFMHNALICINGSTPYNALFGRQPPILPPLEGGYIAETEIARRTDVPHRPRANTRNFYRRHPGPRHAVPETSTPHHKK